MMVVCASDRPRFAKVPAHAQNDDIAVEVSACEQLFQVLQLASCERLNGLHKGGLTSFPGCHLNSARVDPESGTGHRCKSDDFGVTGFPC